MILRSALCGCAIAVLAALPDLGMAQNLTYSIEPAAPKAQEAVRLKVSPASGNSSFPGDDFGRYFGASPSTMTGNRITVVHRSYVPLPIQPPWASNYLELGRFPSGDYEVEVQLAVENGPPQGAVATLQFTVGSPTQGLPRPSANFSDLWWDPAESGWGLSIAQHISDIIFAVWYVYGADGKPIWYFIPEGSWSTVTKYTGPVYKTAGPYFGGVFNPSAVGVTLAGTATLVFTDFDRGTFTYTIDGITGTKSIQRQGF